MVTYSLIKVDGVNDQSFLSYMLTTKIIFGSKNDMLPIFFLILEVKPSDNGTVVQLIRLMFFILFIIFTYTFRTTTLLNLVELTF